MPRDLCDHVYVKGACILCDLDDPDWTVRDQLVEDVGQRIEGFARSDIQPWAENPEGFWDTCTRMLAADLVSMVESRS